MPRLPSWTRRQSRKATATPIHRRIEEGEQDEQRIQSRRPGNPPQRAPGERLLPAGPWLEQGPGPERAARAEWRNGRPGRVAGAAPAHQLSQRKRNEKGPLSRPFFLQRTKRRL